jgi:hypothetical protein
MFQLRFRAPLFRDDRIGAAAFPLQAAQKLQPLFERLSGRIEQNGWL